MPSGVPLNDIVSSHFSVPSPGAVNDKVRAYFDKWYFGVGSPEGVVTAPTGSLYLDASGTTTIIYQKSSGAGNTGWVGVGGASAPLNLSRAAAADDLITGKVTGDANDRWVLNADGSLHWGSGSAAQDLAITRDTIANTALTFRRLTGDVSPMIAVTHDGGAVNGGEISFYQTVTGTRQSRIVHYRNLGLSAQAIASTLVPFQVRAQAGQSVDIFRIYDAAAAIPMVFDASGFLKWNVAAMEQTTVGAAGGAAALPATPTKFLQVKDSAGTTLVVPAYAAA